MNFAVRRSIVAAIVLNSCGTALSAQTPGGGPPAVRASGPLADSLRAFGVNTVAMLRRLDAKGVMALYGNLSQFVHVDDGNVVPWAQLASDMTHYFATAKSNPVSVIGEPGVAIMDANNAVVYVTHRMEATEGRAGHEGVWTGVLHRFPDGWKIVHSHSSDKRPQ